MLRLKEDTQAGEIQQPLAQELAWGGREEVVSECLPAPGASDFHLCCSVLSHPRPKQQVLSPPV